MEQGYLDLFALTINVGCESVQFTPLARLTHLWNHKKVYRPAPTFHGCSAKSGKTKWHYA